MSELILRYLFISIFAVSGFAFDFLGSLPVARASLSFDFLNLTAEVDGGVGSHSLSSSGTALVRLNTEDFLLIDKAGGVTNLTQSTFVQVLSGSINDNGQAAILADGDVFFFDGNEFRNITNGTLVVNSMIGPYVE